MYSDAANDALLNRYILVLVQGVGNNDTNRVEAISIAKPQECCSCSIFRHNTVYQSSSIQSIKLITYEGNWLYE
jgi:hypothetical protein